MKLRMKVMRRRNEIPFKCCECDKKIQFNDIYLTVISSGPFCKKCMEEIVKNFKNDLFSVQDELRRTTNKKTKYEMIG